MRCLQKGLLGLWLKRRSRVRAASVTLSKFPVFTVETRQRRLLRVRGPCGIMGPQARRHEIGTEQHAP
jgi:hypothetical protein